MDTRYYRAIYDDNSGRTDARVYIDSSMEQAVGYAREHCPGNMLLAEVREYDSEPDALYYINETQIWKRKDTLR